MRAVRAIVHGMVQGVGFRAFVERAALERGLEGWVRNCSDGSVETVIAGPDEAIEAMLAMLRRGPREAVVERVDVEDAHPDTARRRLAGGDRFAILPSL
jgi:acylphosphatase